MTARRRPPEVRSAPVCGNGPFIWLNGGMNFVVDSSQGRFDLEPFWTSRQPHLFDQTCPGSPRASRLSAR